MRRKDKEVIDAAKIREIILNSDCMRLGFADADDVYIVPLNFGYEEIGAERIFYFHSAKEGRKIDLIRIAQEKEQAVGFELDNGYELIPDQQACKNSARYRSVIGTGHVFFLENREEKRAVLLKLMEHQTGKTDWQFPDKMLDAVCVFGLKVLKLSSKEHL